MSSVPTDRVRVLNSAPTRASGDYVLYWMIATRRLTWSHALDRAVDLAEELGKPLLILEPLRVAYRWASDRHHQAVIDGMSDQRARLEAGPVGYYPYVEPANGDGKGLLGALAESACAVVTDDSPAFFTPRLLEAAATSLTCRLEAIDSCGLLPLRAADKGFSAAYHFRRFLHRELPAHLGDSPHPDRLAEARIPRFGEVPARILARWPSAESYLSEPAGWTDGDVAAGLADLSGLAIDHSVTSSAWRGGHRAARARLDAFLADGLDRYGEQRNDPDSGAASGLSPWLHYGHISAHEIFDAVARREGWSPMRISPPNDGRRSGWWGMSAAAESFVDQLVTWRELGYGYCAHMPDYERYDSLPEWARETLEEHASDERENEYTLDEFEAAATHDELWNAAQRELVSRGIIHNYLRMLWGKKILEWSRHPREALDIMVELNNKYALDGRDPNSYSGIMWVMGRFDRGWPERPIFGKVRSMTSASTRRKVKLDRYLSEWGPQTSML